MLRKPTALLRQECQDSRADIAAQRQQCAKSWDVLAAATERLACSRQFLTASAQVTLSPWLGALAPSS